MSSAYFRREKISLDAVGPQKGQYYVISGSKIVA